MSLQDERITQLLLETKTIVMIGASLKPIRASHRVGNYMAAQGYRIIPVNPGHEGETLFGERIRARMEDIDEPVDMLNIFRRSEFIPPVVETGLQTLKGLKSVWMQLGLENETARKMAEAAGKTVIENRCLYIEHKRLIAGR